MKQDEYGSRAHLDDVSFLVDHFRLGSLRLIRDLGGTYNLNLLLQAERGWYVLRLYRPWMTQMRLSQLHQIKRLLAHTSLPVPIPLSTITGETILHSNNRLMELEPFIIHDGEADTWKRNARAFFLLGKLHAFLAMEASNIDLVDPVVSNYGTPETLLAWTEQAVAESLQSRHPIKVLEKQQALSLYAETIHLLLSLQEQWNKTNGHLTQQLTHGDYGGGNLLFRRERPVAILDFDFMRIRERVSEIAYTLYWWLCKQGHGQIAEVGSWKKVNELLTCYNEGTSKLLTLEERQALPLEIARVPLYWIAETHVFPNPAQEVLKHADKIANARWIFEHRDQLSDLFVQEE